MEFRRFPVLDVPGVRHDGVRAQRLAQLHRVFERGQRLAAFLRVVDRQHCEVWSMHRHGQPAGGGERTKLGTALLLPGEAGDKRQFDRVVATGNKRVEPGGVIATFRRHCGDSKSDHEVRVSERCG